MRMNSAETRRLLGFTGILLLLGAVVSAGAAHPPSLAQPFLAQPQAGASATVLTLDPAQSKVYFALGSTLHAVHGTFALKSGTVRLSPDTGEASGEIVVNAASGESGSGSRDKKMHSEVLETSRYPEVIFRPDRYEGTLPATGAAHVLVHGTFLLHGSEHKLTVPVQADLAADHWNATAQFPIPYVDWGLKNPSNFILRVDPFVTIDLQMAGSVQRAKAP
jgi:polyisoprenoid-binding protein YceI